jgi:hypothetical protein
MPAPKKYPSAFTSVLEWCRDWMGASAALPQSEQGIPGALERAPPPSAGSETLEPPDYFFEASLLFRCMDMLQIDRNELAKDDPLLFREFQGLCALCPSKKECVRDLAHEFDDARWEKWRAYCPNSAKLLMLGAVQNCALAAQHLKMPRSTTLSNLR